MAAYILLRVEDVDEAAALLGDMACHPNLPLIAPASGVVVHAEVVAGVDRADIPAFTNTHINGYPDPERALQAAVKESYYRSGLLASHAAGGAA